MNISSNYWIYIPFLLAFLQGLITASYIFKSRQNIFLAVLIVLISFGAIADTGIFSEESLIIQILWNGNEFLFGPLLFLAINKQMSKPVKRVFIHFYIFIVMKTFVIVTVLIPVISETIPRWFSLLLSIILCLHGLIYTCYCLYQLYNKPKNKHFKEVRWLKLLVWMSLVAWIFAISAKLIKQFDSLWGAGFFYIVYCTVFIMVYYLSYIVTDRIFPSSPDQESTNDKSPGLQEIPDAMGSQQKYSKSSLTKSQIQGFKDAIDSYFEKERPYLDIDFSFSKLSQTLQINTHQLSQTFSEGFGKTYPQLLKELRINEAVKRLQDEKYAHLSIYGIALDCGFNSKSAFNKAFKEITRFTPTGFKMTKKRD